MLPDIFASSEVFFGRVDDTHARLFQGFLGGRGPRRDATDFADLDLADNVLSSDGADSGAGPVVSTLYYAYANLVTATLALSTTAPVGGFLGFSLWAYVGLVYVGAAGTIATQGHVKSRWPHWRGYQPSGAQNILSGTSADVTGCIESFCPIWGPFFCCGESAPNAGVSQTGNLRIRRDATYVWTRLANVHTASVTYATFAVSPVLIDVALHIGAGTATYDVNTTYTRFRILN